MVLSLPLVSLRRYLSRFRCRRNGALFPGLNVVRLARTLPVRIAPVEFNRNATSNLRTQLRLTSFRWGRAASLLRAMSTSLWVPLYVKTH